MASRFTTRPGQCLITQPGLLSVARQAVNLVTAAPKVNVGSPLARHAWVSSSATSTTQATAVNRGRAGRPRLGRKGVLGSSSLVTLSTQAYGCALIKNKYRTNQILHRLSTSIVDVAFLGRPWQCGHPQGLVHSLLFLDSGARHETTGWWGGKIRAGKLERLNMRKSHPAVSSPGLSASPWLPVAARAKDLKKQKNKKDADNSPDKSASRHVSVCFTRAEQPAA